MSARGEFAAQEALVEGGVVGDDGVGALERRDEFVGMDGEIRLEGQGPVVIAMHGGGEGIARPAGIEDQVAGIGAFGAVA